MDPLKFMLICAQLGLFITEVYTLECYVCTNQNNNVEKCLNTIKTCDQGQDTCLTEIRWGSTPYWSEGAPKQYYVSKRCSSKAECAATRKRYMPYCTHIWYEDWTCSECCMGDRCNYYVINGTSQKSSSIFVALAASFIGYVIAFI